jgi:Skp family chaperone for outer membrane proteins
MSFEMYCSPAVVTCFDADSDLAAAAAAADAAAAAAAAATTGVTFTDAQQAAINKIVAEDKRKHQAQFQKLEKQLQDTLSTAKLTADERGKLEESLEDLRKQSRTKEEQAKIEKKQLEDTLTGRIRELETRAQAAESKYTESKITRSLQDAAIAGDAYNPNTVVTVLRQMVKMVDDNPMIDFQDVETETGLPIIKQMTPTEAIARMKQIPDAFGNLFKSGVVGGVGAASATGGLTPGSTGRIDPTKIKTMEQYLEIRKNNPGALGLR